MFIKGNIFNDTETFDPLNVTLYNDGGASAEDDSDVDGELDNEEDEWSPPTREEWELAQAEKKRLVGESTARKQMLRENGIDLRTGKPKAKGSKSDAKEVETDENVYIPSERDKKVFNREAIAALKEAGVKGSKAKLLARDIDINEWLDDDDYLDTRIDELKEEYSDLFETEEEDDEEDYRPRTKLGLKKNKAVKKELTETDLLMRNAGFRR